jgi:hypothetical protein
MAGAQRDAGRAGRWHYHFFGVINSGSGQVWIDELSFEVVGKNVPVDVMPPSRLPEKPVL